MTIGLTINDRELRNLAAAFDKLDIGRAIERVIPLAGKMIIYHCPYCGLKLEVPDAKIEVRQKVLVDWVDGLEEALEEATFGYGSVGKLRIQQAIVGIREVLWR